MNPVCLLDTRRRVMNVSELVTHLNKQLENNGDCEVVLYVPTLGYEIDIEDLQDSSGNGNFVIIGLD